MLRTPSDFAALSAAPGVTTPLLGVRHRTVAVTESTASLRLGIATSRKVGNAVVRNRVKRLVREFFRHHTSRITPAQDIVVIARTEAAQATAAHLTHELRTALRLDRDCEHQSL